MFIVLVNLVVQPIQMKTIIVLSLVQTAVLIFLLGKFVLFEQDTNVTERAVQNTVVSESVYDPASDRSTIYYMDDNQLRQIIREELAAQLGGSSGTDKNTDASIASNVTDHSEIQYQRELVAQQLEYHTSVGSISDADMQKLQGDIAMLDAAGRTEMLGKLTRALNTGGLDGRL
jgi:4-hydroxyphenylpyruvate dioxygenase-like putative hemolysin